MSLYLYAAVYLGIINPDSTQPLDTFACLAGHYEDILDLGVGDGVSVPAEVETATTRIPVHLAPGEGTILRLGKAR